MNEKKTKDELVRLRSEVKALRTALKRRSPRLNALLKQRGFSIYKKEPVSNLFVPAQKHFNAYYAMLHKYSFRLFLRDVIKHGEAFTLEDVTRYATPHVTGEYLDALLSLKLIRKKGNGFSRAKGPVTSFGATLEWYVAEVFKREFGSEAVWGVKFKRPRVGGDYDVIASIDSALVYLEVKSSPPKQIYESEVTAFFDRVQDLAPTLALFLVDTELRMKDKLVPMFEQELNHRFAYPPEIVRLERELFQIQDRIFILNAKENIIQNIEKMVSHYYQKSMGLM